MLDCPGPSMPQCNLSVVYWPECQQAWRLRAGKGLMPPIDVVVSCRIWSHTHPFEEERWMGRMPFAWETISINGLGSTDTLGASTGWDIYLMIAACGVGLPQYAPVQLKRRLLTWMSTSLEVEGRESQWASGWWKLWHMDAPVVPMLE